MRWSNFASLLLLSNAILLNAVSTNTAVAGEVAVPICSSGMVWEDRNGNGQRDPGERPLAGIKLSDGQQLVTTDAQGHYRLPANDGRTVFIIKPAAYALPERADGLPDAWKNSPSPTSSTLKYGGLRDARAACKDFGLVPQPRQRMSADSMRMLVFSDTQTKSMQDVDYYLRDIVQPLLAQRDQYQLGTTLGDVVNDDLSLYPQLKQVTAQLGLPWLHIPGNHDLDFDAGSDEESLLSYRNQFGPDTFAWEEPLLTFIGLDDVVYQPGVKPAYVGGLREDQFRFLQEYLPTVRKDRLLVLAMHIPTFLPDPGRETFRLADRQRLFDLLKDFPHVLLLSGHSHTQQQWFHGADEGWHGTQPLHEYNVGAACGAFWSGVKDAQGIPDSRMADGTPNGYADLRVAGDGSYALAWHAARDPEGSHIGLHLPQVLRQGAYPAWGVYANVYMGDAASRVEFRVDGADWKPMTQVRQPDPGLLAENVRDDQAPALRGYDRSPEAVPSAHLWRGALPTDLSIGEHQVEVRVFDRWQGEQRVQGHYRLQDAKP
ncbi:calcineurin-like phosphoesterase C-terminal domain-containing protein [Pseudoxanthomonas dokdonensis]|uniref:Calcineurin phosphoesterase n=1 Tax=Pseudoxanthomonas dokdonensis TaxID=344882 RepID=A0A0R0D0N2_9GAMM|nr:calcineurin-like phosphoesterase family protein [Pseudoxanthomonas dokdonensis]KRG70952.1 calcineurin phosphoesterase [Pseudoxanthomonas dokdonensis]